MIQIDLNACQFGPAIIACCYKPAFHATVRLSMLIYVIYWINSVIKNLISCIC